MSGRKHLLVVYHSLSGNTRQLAGAVRAGALTDGDVEVRLCRAMSASSKDLLWCDGVLLGTPENFARLSGGLKDFFDRTFYPLEPRQLNLPYGLFVSAGNDGRNAVAEVERIIKGYPFKAIAEPLIIRGDIDDGSLRKATELGATMAAGLAMGIF